MHCRVGITTDPLLRRNHWDTCVVGLRNWLVVSTHPTKTEALQAEKKFAEVSGCLAVPDEDGPLRASWSVYRFTYDHDVG